MKTLKLLILLALFSLQAGATGYSHNMFVAHKKLQVGKECPSEKIIAKKAKVSKQVKYSVETKHAATIFFNTRFTDKMPEKITLNERILEEGPASFFESEQDSSSDDSVVTKLVSVVRCVVYAFIGSPKF